MIVRSYDLAVNLQAWGTCLMMAALDEERAEEWLGKARALEERLAPWLGEKGALPDYGDLRTQDGRIVHGAAALSGFFAEREADLRRGARGGNDDVVLYPLGSGQH